MALEQKGMDGKWYNHSSVDLLNKYKSSRDYNSLVVQLLASIGTELENITELLKDEIVD